MTLTVEEKREVVQQFGKSDTDTGSPEVQIALLTAPDQPPHRASARAQARPPLAPRPPDARRSAPPAAQLPPGARTSTATAGSSRNSACADDRARHGGARLRPSGPGREHREAGGPARADDRARLLPDRLQPGLHRPAERLPGGARRPRGRGRPAPRHLRGLGLGAQGVPEPPRRHDPAARRLPPEGRGREGLRRVGRRLRRRRPRARDDRPRPRRPVVHRSPSPLEIPGANLIFDALNQQPGRLEPQAAGTTTSAATGRW